MSYIELLNHDFIKIKHPLTQKEVKLYRIISNKSFRINIPIQGESNKTSIPMLTEPADIDRYAVGGYVQSLKNIDVTNPVWIDNDAKVFDNAIIKNFTYVANKALIFQDAVVDNSYVGEYAKIYNATQVTDSWIANMTTVKNNAIVTKSKILNYSMVYENAKVTSTLMTGGSYVNGNANVTNSILNDYSMAGGNSMVNNVTLNERASLVNINSRDKTISADPNLSVERGIG